MPNQELLASVPLLCREFARYKQVVQNRGEKTVSEYLLDLRTFFRYTVSVEKGLPLDPAEMEKLDITGVDIDHISRINSDTIVDFIIFTSDERGNKEAAKSRKLCALRGFYKFLVGQKHLLEDNPVLQVETPKMSHPLPKFLSLEESLVLLGTVSRDTDNPHRIRDFCIITLFLNCGMRVSELCGIDLRDLDPSLYSVRVLGKGNKERILYLNDACQAALSEYLTERTAPEMEPKAKTKALFLSGRYNRISVKTVQWMVYKYLDMAGFGNRHLSVHKLRHTAATLLYKEGHVDVRLLKEILGHEQLNTTQIYTHVSDAGLAAAMEKNPLASMTLEKMTPEEVPAENTDGDEEAVADGEEEKTSAPTSDAEAVKK